MKFIQIKNPESSVFRGAWRIYQSSFPANERRTLKQQKDLLRNMQYHFISVFKDKRLVAIIAYWDLNSFLFIEHLAVKKKFRGKGIGTELLKEYLTMNKQKAVLEVEMPRTKSAIKRIRFYRKIGFKLNTFNYIQPSLGKDKCPVPLFLMTYPESIGQSKFLITRKKIHTIVHGLEKPLLVINNYI